MTPIPGENPVAAALTADVEIDEEAARQEQEDAEKAAKEQEEAAVKQWFKRIEASKKRDKDERAKWRRWRSFVAGTPEDEDGEAREFLVDAPLLQGVMETTQANIYAKDPDVSVQPEESVTESRYEMVRAFCKTLQIVLSRLFKDGDLKSAIKRQSLSAMTNSVGWVKVLLQLDKKSDPLILNQISDMQDNLRRVDSLMRSIADPAACADVEVLKAELTNQLRALEERVEVVTARGAVFDFVRCDDVFVDENLREVVDYKRADWLGHRDFMEWDKAKDKFGLTDEKMAGATSYSVPDDGSQPTEIAKGGTDQSGGKGSVAVIEIWDRTSSTIHTLIEGLKCYARPPYSPQPASRRFYPLFLLGFHFVDGLRWPRSDVDLAHKLQEEASRALSGFAEHRRRVRPKTIFNKQQLKPEDVDAIQNAENIEFVGVDPVDPAADVSKMLHVPQYPNVDPGLYDIGPYRAAIEELFGLQDAARGAVVKAKTATEAGFQDASRETRMDWRRDYIEGEITEIACYLAELSLQAMPLEEVQKYAGPDAMWPEFTKDEIYSLVSISIRGGSSGKPDTRAEREAWATIMPLIDKSITEIAQLMSNPMTAPMAELKIELLRETVRRLDDRIDVTRFLPKPGMVPVLPPAVSGATPGQPGAPNLTAVPAAAAA